MLSMFRRQQLQTNIFGIRMMLLNWNDWDSKAHNLIYPNHSNAQKNSVYIKKMTKLNHFYSTQVNIVLKDFWPWTAIELDWHTLQV